MKMKKVLAAALSLACASTLFAATAVTASAADKKEVVIWDYFETDAQKEMMQSLIDGFNASQDEYEASHVYVPFADYEKQLTLGIASGELPDLVILDGCSMASFIQLGLFGDISDVDINWDEYMEGPMESTMLDGKHYGIPFATNCTALFYNKDMFEENGWEIPETWNEFLELLDTIQASGQQPLYFGFKDVWTCLAPWNAMACDLAPADVCQQVNRGETTFSVEYRELAEKILQLLPYAQEDPYAYSYNDACTAFARGESAMYCIGSYAVPQIKSVNPDMNIDSFVFPANDSADGQILNSGVDLQFCVMEDCKDKEAAYEVLRFMLEDENIQIYLDDQNAVPCKEGDFTLPSMLDGMKEYIEQGKMTDYQDHYYPAEMAVDAMIQTYLMNQDTDAWLKKFDSDWKRYNRDLIRKVQEYQEENGEGGSRS